MITVTNKTGWVACDYSKGNNLDRIPHSDVYATADEAKSWNDSWRENYGENSAYEGIRFVGSDGYLLVDEQGI